MTTEGRGRLVFLWPSFVAGALTASFVWWATSTSNAARKSTTIPPEKEGPTEEITHPPKDTSAAAPTTPASPTLQPTKGRPFWRSLSDFFLRSSSSQLSSSTTTSAGPTSDSWDWRTTTRIGELPRRIRLRSQWPWQTLGRRTSSSAADDNSSLGLSRTTSSVVAEQDEEEDDDGDDGDNDQDDGADADDDKSNFCIGSIFGLDVGGTLAKLVYFEEVKPEDIPHSAATAGTTSNASNHHNVTSRYNNAAAQPPSPKHRLTKSQADLGALHALSPDRTGLPRLPEGSHADDDNDGDDNNNGLHHSLRKSHSDEFPKAVGSSNTSPTVNGGGTFRGTTNGKATASTTTAGHSSQGAATLPKIHSMLDLQFTNRDRKEALERFYNFAKHLDYRDHQLRFYSRELGGYFHFVHFETRRMQEAMDLIRKHNLQRNIRQMGATGGGAHKFADDFYDHLGITMKKEGELESLVAGMQFVLSTVVGECYSFRPPNEKKAEDRHRVPPKIIVSRRNDDYGDYFGVNEAGVSGNPSSSGSDNGGDHTTLRAHPEPAQPNSSMKIDDWWWSRKVQRDSISYSSTYPYLVVTIGTGVSILRVDGPRKHERISGSSIGGGTYWGLIRLLTSYEQFDDVMRLAERGDPSKVDMMVGDIYGGNSDALDRLGLRADLVASSFGKLVAKEDPADGLTEEDLARALLLMVTNNIGQVAFLNAELHNTERIYFVGNFLRQNRLSQRRLAYAIDYWSKGKMEALFLEHEGYFGALGGILAKSRDPASRDTPQSFAQPAFHAFAYRDHAPSTPTETASDL